MNLKYYVIAKIYCSDLQLSTRICICQLEIMYRLVNESWKDA